MPEDLQAQTDSRRSTIVLMSLAALALALGMYARFKGLGKWPFDVDEFYTARSVENVLRSGLPQYACGGFYMRTLLMQYVGAGLQLMGLGPEFSLRFIAAVSSIATLPAAYLIARRIQGPTLGVLVVMILALSVWEVEMARFARMYAPFQAVFLWYVVYFLRYAVDKDAKALWPMVILSLVGVLVWEGGVFLAATNLLPPLLNQHDGRLRGLNWRYIVFAALLVGPLYLLATNNLRVAGEEYPFPPGFVDQTYVKTVMGHPIGGSPWQTLTRHSLWALGALVPLAALAFAVRWVFTLRDRWITVAGLLAALAAALLHQFLLSIGILMILILLGALSARELFSRAALPFWGAIAVALVFWTGYAVLNSDWRFAGQGRSLFMVFYELVRFPDVVSEVVLPWARAVPRLSLLLFVLLGFAFIRALLTPARPQSVEHVILLILVCLVLAACASKPPRHETRYVFFLYPLAIIVVLAELTRLVEWVTRSVNIQRLAPYGAALAALALFAGTEDIDFRHLSHVDDADVNFRVGMSTSLAAHYEPRHDTRAAAAWLERNTTDADVVINSFQSLDYYSKRIDYFFLEEKDRRFTGWSCKGGSVQRWDNTPLIYTIEALQAKFDNPQRVFFVGDEREFDEILPHLERWKPRVVWTQRHMAIVAFDRTGRQPSISAGSIVRVAGL